MTECEVYDYALACLEHIPPESFTTVGIAWEGERIVVRPLLIEGPKFAVTSALLAEQDDRTCTVKAAIRAVDFAREMLVQHG